MANLPLGNSESDYDSKKSRGRLINMIPEGDKKGYKSVRSAEGLTLFTTGMEAPMRSNLLVNGGYIYLVSGTKFYRIDSTGASTALGTVNGSGQARLAANAIPGDSQIVILNGSGVGYIYSVALGFLTITDTDFFSSSSVTVLNERFWFVRDGTSEIFGSDVSDGTSYNPLTFATAEESPDLMKCIIRKGSSLYLLGEQTTEIWQSIDDITLPIRKVNGATKEWGIIAKDSLAEANDAFVFLANDRTVRLIQNNQIIEISDLDFTLKVKGNGTNTFPGFTKIDDAIGFFVDGPIHKTYYLTFPSEGYTWGYDLNTGLTHTRESEGLGYWRANGATLFNSKIICGDLIEGKLWILDPSNKTENGSIMRRTLITPSISTDKNITIPLVEFDMEVAQHNDPSLDPQMMNYFSRDGGNTWIQRESISLGAYGDFRARVSLRQFGRLVRNKDFCLKLEVTDAVGLQFYGAQFYPEVDM